MRQFYRQIQTDDNTMCFMVQCPICGKQQSKVSIPFLCRGRKKVALCESGKAGRFSKTMFNHAKASAVQYYARFFNQCRCCYRWVCDDCYDTASQNGICMDCSKTSAERNSL